jgi:hemolysin activation/secretion protein
MGADARKALLVAAFISILISPFVQCAAIPDNVKAGSVTSTVEKTTPQKDKPTIQPLKFEAPPRPELEETGAAIIKVSKFKITGNTKLSTDAIAELLKPYEGFELTLYDLRLISNVITQAYRQKGYFLARAYVPVQTIQNGVVEIAVLEGKVGAVTVSGNKYYRDKYITGMMQPVVKDQVISRQNLEGALLNMNENPKLNVQATLSPGSQLGTVNLDLKAKDSFPYNLTFYYNNFGSKFTGQNRFGAMLDLGNITGHADILSLGYVTPVPGWESDFYRKVAYSFPVGTYGTRMGITLADMNYEVGKELALLGIVGESKIASLYLTHPLVRTSEKTVNLEASLSYRGYKNYLFGSILSAKDEISALGVGISGVYVKPGHRDIYNVTVSTGLGELFGGMGDLPPLPSKPGVDNTWLKVNADISHLIQFNNNIALLLRGSGQLSNKQLAVGEKYAIGGADTVRGYPQSEYLGDDAYTLSAELRTPILPGNLKVNKYAQWAFFYDIGGAYLKKPLPGEHKSITLQGYGAGIRFFIGKNFDFRFDAGFPIKGEEPSDGDNYHYYFQGQLKF